jgi:hypothetical protein
MLVSGEGRQIPFTDSYVWPIQDAIAVIEVKKNLFGTDLDDAFRKLRRVMQMHGAFLQSGAGGQLNMSPVLESFTRLTGHYPRNGNDVDALPHELSGIFHTLGIEHLAPVRMIFGYEGYTDEFSLRNGLVKYLEDNLATSAGFGINEGIDPDRLIAGLVQRRRLAWSNDHTVRLITTAPLVTGFTPDGRMLTTTETDLLDLWLREQR